MGSWGRSQMKMKWKAKVQLLQLCKKDGTADNRKACRNNGSTPQGRDWRNLWTSQAGAGGVYGKVFQQIGAVGLLTTTETCISLCDLFAQCFVVMASLRGAWDSGALTQGTQGAPWHGRTFLTKCSAAEGPTVLVLSLSSGLVRTVFGDSLRPLPFYEGDTRNLWLSLFKGSLS